MPAKPPPLLLLAALALSGCRATPAYQGSNQQVLATYHYRNLSADLPPDTRIPAIAVAARATLLERGYSIESESITEDHADFSAVPPNPDLFESLDVTIKQTNGGPQVRVTAQPLGDQPKSRAILEGILAKLGR